MEAAKIFCGFELKSLQFKEEKKKKKIKPHFKAKSANIESKNLSFLF